MGIRKMKVKQPLKAVHFFGAVVVATISVAGGVESVLQGEIEAAVVDDVDVLNCHVFVDQGYVASAAVEYVAGFKCYAELIVEECAVEFHVEAGGGFLTGIVAVSGTHPLHVDVQPNVAWEVNSVLELDEGDG